MITLNPNDKGSGVTLSNNNLTASIVDQGGVRATKGKTSGKWYWEVTTSSNSGYLLLGVETINANLSSYAGHDMYGWSIYQYDGTIYNSNTHRNYAKAYIGAHVIGIALDMDNKTLSFSIDGISYGIAYTGLPSTTIYAAVSNTYLTNVITINFGATAFTYPVPNGYVAYDKNEKFLIQDNNNLENSSDGTTLLNVGTTPYTIDKFNTYGMDNLFSINSNVISKIINDKYNISLLK